MLLIQVSIAGSRYSDLGAIPGGAEERHAQRMQLDETNTSAISQNFPTATSQHIGRRVQSAPAQRMSRLEMTMHRGKRKTKDLMYY